MLIHACASCINYPIDKAVNDFLLCHRWLFQRNLYLLFCIILVHFAVVLSYKIKDFIIIH